MSPAALLPGLSSCSLFPSSPPSPWGSQRPHCSNSLALWQLGAASKGSTHPHQAAWRDLRQRVGPGGPAPEDLRSQYRPVGWGDRGPGWWAGVPVSPSQELELGCEGRQHFVSVPSCVILTPGVGGRGRHLDPPLIAEQTEIQRS